jgi:hypothetical protein
MTCPLGIADCPFTHGTLLLLKAWREALSYLAQFG